MAKYSSEGVSMIELLRNLKFFGIFNLSPIGELLDTMRNSNLKKLLKRLLEKLFEIFLVFELFWDFVFIEIFCK